MCFDLLTLYLYATHTTGMPQLKIITRLSFLGQRDEPHIDSRKADLEQVE